VTACVIASDEERRLPECLESLAFCDQILVVDGGSRDRTREVARAAGAEVIDNPWPGFAAQRNVALDHAQGDWVLEIDADERVSPSLAEEIRRMLAGPPAGVSMVAIPMRDVFLGRPLGPSARYPRYRHRLFRRGAFRHDESRTVHEGLWPDGPVLPLEGELAHLLAASWREALGDAVAYARLEGRQQRRRGPLAAVTGILLRPAAKLAYRSLLYGGWRDGARGLAKIGLECGADSLAALYGLRGPAGGESGGSSDPPRIGPVRLVGVGLGGEGAARLAQWLAEADRAGADVALICGSETPGTAVAVRPAPGAGPGALARALDAEDQIRPIDALVLAGRRERLLLSLCPRALRGCVPPRRTSEEVPGALRNLRDLVRQRERPEL
jgi:hypothetical protein